jgi:hypothetical protein
VQFSGDLEIRFKFDDRILFDAVNLSY